MAKKTKNKRVAERATDEKTVRELAALRQHELETLSPLGPDDHTVQVTYTSGEETALFTCRLKDQDLTREQLLALAHACMTQAMRMPT